MAGLSIIRGWMDRIPQTLFIICGSVLTAILGATARGDWILMAVGIYKQFENPDHPSLLDKRVNETRDNNTDTVAAPGALFRNLHWFLLASLAVTFITYYSMCGFLQYYFYIRQKDKAAEWKCQPNRWLTKENERHEIMLGSINMAIGGTISGIVATYVFNGGHTQLYFQPMERGPVYLVLSTVLLFLYQDGMAYYMHRFCHYPWMYRNIHKLHHRYHSPTAFSASAMHPAEFVSYQLVFGLPIFFVPLYSGAFILTLLYGYYYGLADHSGVHLEALWPWQPPSIFHDDHHRYFHTNFGFNTYLWDWMHGTLREKDRVYGEDVFYGRGRAKVE